MIGRSSRRRFSFSSSSYVSRTSQYWEETGVLHPFLPLPAELRQAGIPRTAPLLPGEPLEPLLVVGEQALQPWDLLALHRGVEQIGSDPVQLDGRRLHIVPTAAELSDRGRQLVDRLLDPIAVAELEPTPLDRAPLPVLEEPEPSRKWRNARPSGLITSYAFMLRRTVQGWRWKRTAWVLR